MRVCNVYITFICNAMRCTTINYAVPIFYYMLCYTLCCDSNTNRLQIGFIELCSISITEMQTTNGINSQLSITHSDRQDSGVYKCSAENPFGKSEHVIYVAVQGMYAFCIKYYTNYKFIVNKSLQYLFINIT